MEFPRSYLARVTYEFRDQILITLSEGSKVVSQSSCSSLADKQIAPGPSFILTKKVLISINYRADSQLDLNLVPADRNRMRWISI